MTSLTNKLVDWSSNYHKTARTFLKSSALPRSINKLTLNKTALETLIVVCDICTQPRDIVLNPSQDVEVTLGIFYITQIALFEIHIINCYSVPGATK